MTSTALDTELEKNLVHFQPKPAQSPASSHPRDSQGSRAEIRRLSPIAKQALARKSPPPKCCDGACGMDDPRHVMAAIVRGAQEVINGARPLNTLVRWLTSEAYADVAKRTSLQARSTRPTHRTVTITSTHVCRIGHDIVEGTVILSDGGRVRAAAIRLEAFRGRWRASYLQTV